jgi:prephenate dehydratase
MDPTAAPAEGAHPLRGGGPRVGYLGPRGTFSDTALRRGVDVRRVQPVPLGSIHEAVMAVQAEAVRWSIVPIENSIEGPVTVTLDALAGEASDVRIVGELVLPVRQCLIARAPVDLADITTVVSHPQPAGQCAAFLREHLAQATVRSANSTAEAVRVVAEADQPNWAALGPALAADLYGCVVLREGVEDRHDNETRFVWLARRPGDHPPAPPGRTAPGDEAPQKTSLVFWGSGAGHPGWLVACLNEFALRAVNLTKIESRPQRSRLGNYIFFVDLDGGEDAPAVARALAGLREHCDAVHVLGSYPAAR